MRKEEVVIRNQSREATKEELENYPESVITLGEDGTEIRAKSLMVVFSGEATVNGETTEAPEGFKQEDGMGVMIVGPWSPKELVHAGAVIHGEVKKFIEEMGPGASLELMRMLLAEAEAKRG